MIKDSVLRNSGRSSYGTEGGKQVDSMSFGEKVRELRLAKGLTLRDLAAKVGVGFTYLSKIENHKLEEGHGPSEKLIHKLAAELDTSEDELLLLAEKVPEPIRKRVCQRPEVFRVVAEMNDKEMDQFLEQYGGKR
jgi:transcriptional regulator with XRE-family HTH domain